MQIETRLDDYLFRDIILSGYQVVKKLREKKIVVSHSRYESSIESLFIERVLARMRPSTINLAESPAKTHLETISGGHMLHALLAYFNDEFRLESRFGEVDGKLFSEIAIKYQNRLEDTNFTFQVLVLGKESKKASKVHADVIDWVSL